MIVILCESGIGFPNGTASTRRVTLYAQGLIQSGKEILILLLGSSEYALRIFNNQSKGEINGIKFEYACGTPLRAESFLKRRWLNIKGMAVATLRLFQLKRLNNIEAIIIYESAFPLTEFWFWLISRFLRCLILRERNEHPFFEEGKGMKSKTYQYFYTNLVCRRIDGVIVISNYLKEIFVKIIGSNAKIIKIPVLVDVDLFDILPSEAPSKFSYITYTGLLNEQKDGVLTLMKSFKEIYGEFPNVILRLVGDSKIATKIPEFQIYAKELGISDRVEFTGMVRLDQIPLYLKNSTILVLAKPSNLLNQANFPTKVAEYLASGKPIVITRTGELDEYLQDGVNVYFSEPDNHKAFSERLRYALNHPVDSCLVGFRGQAVAREYFGYKENMQRLAKFLDQMNDKVADRLIKDTV